MPDDPKVQNILDTLTRGWNDKDGEAWSSVFSDRARYVDVFGTLHDPLSRADNARLHHAGWGTVYRHSHASFDLHTQQLLVPGLVLLMLRGQIDFEIEGQPRQSRNVVTAIVRDGLIEYFHNTPVRPRPSAPAASARDQATGQDA